MIKNRLAELLAQRQLKITKVAKDTGISRNTITATAQNDGTMIKLETIDILCNYLGVTPSEFFEFIPVLFDINVMTTNLELDYHRDSAYTLVGFDAVTYTSDIFLDITYHGKKTEFSLECQASLAKSNIHEVIFDIHFTSQQELEMFQNLSAKINSYMFSSKIAKTLSESLLKDFETQFMDYEDDALSEAEREMFLSFYEQNIKLDELYSLKY